MVNIQTVQCPMTIIRWGWEEGGKYHGLQEVEGRHNFQQKVRALLEEHFIPKEDCV